MSRGMQLFIGTIVGGLAGLAISIFLVLITHNPGVTLNSFDGQTAIAGGVAAGMGVGFTAVFGHQRTQRRRAGEKYFTALHAGLDTGHRGRGRKQTRNRKKRAPELRLARFHGPSTQGVASRANAR